MKNFYELINSQLEKMSTRSAWAKGVAIYAAELLEELESNYDDTPWNEKELSRRLLNGASSWDEYSWGGCSLIYDKDIASRLCTPSELKKTHNGERKPNSREEWLDVQVRALNQAARRIIMAYRRCIKED